MKVIQKIGKSLPSVGRLTEDAKVSLKFKFNNCRKLRQEHVTARGVKVSDNLYRTGGNMDQKKSLRKKYMIMCILTQIRQPAMTLTRHRKRTINMKAMTMSTTCRTHFLVGTRD